MPTPDRALLAAVAVTRFGLGARPGEIAAAAHDPGGWLTAQIRPGGAAIPRPCPASGPRLAELRGVQHLRQEVRIPAATQDSTVDRNPVKAAQKRLRAETGQDFLARAQLAATTADGFAERWALFWSNHFTVSANKLATANLVGPFESEAIRPHVFGRFVDLLDAAENHPAMLLYLDQARSVGPNSPAAQRAVVNPAAGPRPGLNENLAREILELHTVGVNGGYNQADVTEFARAMTGRSVAREPDVALKEPVVFRPATHEPGARTILGDRYPEPGEAQSTAVLHDLAAKPAAARFICGKIARHFVADTPPPALAARLEQAWTSSDGDLSRVAEALVAAPEAWDPQPAKFKTPYEFVVSSYRAADVAPSSIEKLAPILTALGQQPFCAPSPRGWADETDPWVAPDAIVKRMQYAQGFSAVASQGRDPSRLAAEALGARLTPAVATAIAHAESRPEGLALLLMSPEFQRR